MGASRRVSFMMGTTPNTPSAVEPFLHKTPSYTLAERWVARGLVLVVLGDRWITPTGTRIMQPEGSVQTAYRSGRGGTPSIGYGTATAGNTTGRLRGFRLEGSINRSYFGTYKALSLGSGGFGRIFQDVTGNGIDARAGQHGIWMTTANGRNLPTLQISDSLNAQNQFYVNAGPVYTYGTWASYGFSIFADPASQPSLSTPGPVWCFRDGSRIDRFITGSVTTNTFGNPAPTDLVFGNRPSDSARSFDGEHGIFAAFNSFLSEAEHASLNANPSQLLSYRNTTAWVPA